jgi:hypothetical protein
MSVPPESVVPPPPSEPRLPATFLPKNATWAMFAHLSALLGAIAHRVVRRGLGLFHRAAGDLAGQEGHHALRQRSGQRSAELQHHGGDCIAGAAVLSIITFGIGLDHRDSAVDRSSVLHGWC